MSNPEIKVYKQLYLLRTTQIVETKLLHFFRNLTSKQASLTMSFLLFDLGVIFWGLCRFTVRCEYVPIKDLRRAMDAK